MTTFDDVLTWSGTSLYDAGDALKAVANKYEDVYEELTGLSTDGLEGKTAEAEAKARSEKEAEAVKAENEAAAAGVGA